MTEEKSGSRLRDLALEELRNWTPLDEIRPKYSNSVLYAALIKYIPEIADDAEEARRRIVEVKTTLGESENQLKKLNASVTEAEIKRGEAEAGLVDITARKAEVEEQVKGLEEKRRVTASEVTSLKEGRRKAIEAAGVTEKQLADFIAVKTRLKEHGLDLENIDATDSAFSSISKLDKDPKRIIDVCSRVNDLEAEERRLQELATTRQGAVTESEATLTKLQAKITGSKDLVDQINYVDALGATTREVGAVMEAALRSAALNGYTTEEALASLTLDLGENYGVTRRLREEADLLKKKQGNIERLIAAGDERLEALTKTIKEKEEVLASHRSINEAGVSDKDLISIQGAMAEYEDDASSFKKKMEELGGLKKYIAVQTPAAEKLSATVSQLTRSIAEKEARLSELDNLFIQRGKEYADRLGVCLKAIESSTGSLDSKLNSVLEDYYCQIDVGVAKTTAGLQIAFDQQNTALANGFKQFGITLDEVLNKAKEMRDYAVEAGARLGRLGTLESIMALLSDREVDSRELSIQLYAYVGVAKEAMTKKGRSDWAGLLDRMLLEMKRLDGSIDL